MRIEAAPGGGGRKGGRRRTNPLLDPLDQVQLPQPALKLPDAERREKQGAGQAEGKEKPALAPTLAYGVVLTCPPAMPGIMFVLRWYMIHSEPAIVMMTITPVNT